MTDPDFVDIVTMLRAADRLEPYLCAASADEIERLRKERDEARREAMLLLSDRASTKEMNAEYKKRGWEYLKRNAIVSEPKRAVPPKFDLNEDERS